MNEETEQLSIKTSFRAGNASQAELHSISTPCQYYGLNKLINSGRKKVTLIFILFLSIISYFDLLVIFYDPPSKSDFFVSEGVLGFDAEKIRVGRQLFLKTENKKEYFFCGITSGGSQCIKSSEIPKYKGQFATLLWAKKKNVFNLPDMQGNILYQIEIDGKIVINYEDQKERYLNSKNHSYIFPIFLLASVVFFILDQFTNTELDRMMTWTPPRR